METAREEWSPDREIAGFWRRIGALVIDCFLLGILGMVIGAFAFDALAHMGAYARLIGFAIALVYFGVLNSRIGGGQTLGKRWLGVRVVDAHDQLLSLPRSLLRYAVLGIPFFANRLPTPIDPEWAMSTPLGYLLALVVFGGILSIVYLYVFNQRTRQSLHDLAVGSYVERFNRISKPSTFPTPWRGHLVVVAVIAVASLILPSVADWFSHTGTFADLLPLYKTLSSEPHVTTVQLTRGSITTNGNTKRYLASLLRMDSPLTDDKAMAKHIAQIMAKVDAQIADEDNVVVSLVYGYDMGIAHGWMRRGFSFRPDELRENH